MYSDLEKSQLQISLISNIIKCIVKKTLLITNYDLIKIEIPHKEKEKLESLIRLYKKLTQKSNCNIKSTKLSTEIEFGLCNFFYNTRNYDDALEQIENIIKLQPNNTKAIYCKV
ncbi:MAG: hypothetical protein WAN47_02875, partial [Nitrosotalea sp.]